LAWIFFRAASVSQGLTIIRKIFFAPGPLFIDSRAYLFYSFFGIFCLLLLDRRVEKAGPGAAWLGFRSAGIRLTSYALVIILILAIGVLDGGQFIYFQF
jgi:alginate O-acetyltransferase complex protein AlgI